MPISNYILSTSKLVIPAILVQKLGELSSFVQDDIDTCLNQALQQVGNVDEHAMLSVITEIEDIFKKNNYQNCKHQYAYLIKL